MLANLLSVGDQTGAAQTSFKGIVGTATLHAKIETIVADSAQNPRPFQWGRK